MTTKFVRTTLFFSGIILLLLFFLSQSAFALYKPKEDQPIITEVFVDLYSDPQIITIYGWNLRNNRYTPAVTLGDMVLNVIKSHSKGIKAELPDEIEYGDYLLTVSTIPNGRYNYYDNNSQFNLGSTFESLGKIDKAIYHYNQALQINPNDSEARYRLKGLSP